MRKLRRCLEQYGDCELQIKDVSTVTEMYTQSIKLEPQDINACQDTVKHPPYAAMIAAAINELRDKKGSSRHAILKYVVANNKVDADKAAVRVKLALRKMIASKKVVAAAAAGKKGAGSYKLAAVEKKPKAKKVKKPKAKKPAKKAKKPAKKPVKKAAKKPAAKKAAKKPAAKKPAAKKPAAKKAAKKPAAKKAAKK